MNKKKPFAFDSGEYSYSLENINVKWTGMAELKIGKFCSIAENLTIFFWGGGIIMLVAFQYIRLAM